jgi:hypothetical protein
VKEQEMEIGIARKRKDKYALIDLYNSTDPGSEWMSMVK